MDELCELFCLSWAQITLNIFRIRVEEKNFSFGCDKVVDNARTASFAAAACRSAKLAQALGPWNHVARLRIEKENQLELENISLVQETRGRLFKGRKANELHKPRCTPLAHKARGNTMGLIPINCCNPCCHPAKKKSRFQMTQDDRHSLTTRSASA